MYVYCIYRATLIYTFLFLSFPSEYNQVRKMAVYRLRPSDIMYSQRTIAPHFQNGLPLEKLRDQICYRAISIRDIPMISVKFLPDGSYLSLDNRRLWVFKELENRGVINFILVKRINWIPSRKWGYMDYVTTVRCYPDPSYDRCYLDPSYHRCYLDPSYDRCYNYCTNYIYSYDDICSQINCWHI